MSATSPGAPLTRQLLANVTADETLSPWVDVRGYGNVSFYLTSVGTTSSGVVTLEECLGTGTAPNAPPLGETTDGYSVITTVNASTFSGTKQVAVHCGPQVAFGFVRARISTAIGGGGDVSVGLVAC